MQAPRFLSAASQLRRATAWTAKEGGGSSNHMAASINWGPFVLAVLIIRALLLGVYLRAPDVWKLPHGVHGFSGCAMQPGIHPTV